MTPLEQILAYLAKVGMARTNAIATHCQVAAELVTELLQPHVDNGDLVTCLVSARGASSEREYRVAEHTVPGVWGGQRASRQVARVVGKGDLKLQQPVRRPSTLVLEKHALGWRAAPQAPSLTAPSPPNPPAHRPVVFLHEGALVLVRADGGLLAFTVTETALARRALIGATDSTTTETNR